MYECCLVRRTCGLVIFSLMLTTLFIEIIPTEAGAAAAFIPRPNKLLYQPPELTAVSTTFSERCDHQLFHNHRQQGSNRYLQNPALLRADYYAMKTMTTLRQQKDTPDLDNSTSKGIVSILTDVVNFVVGTWSTFYRRTDALSVDVTAVTTTPPALTNNVEPVVQQQPPSSPLELLERIRNDYTERNYLWTGDLDVTANFVPSCRFTDPTLSFVGTDKYVNNIQNLRPILNVVTDVDNECRSDLLDIQLYDTYIQTRWNMVGTLSRLPWQPQINVIGQTKFWFHHNNSYQIYFYDEIWEIPANQALLQLITPRQ